jgi:hypothetical protein
VVTKKFSSDLKNYFQVDVVFFHPVPNRNPVNPQKPGGLGLISPALLQGFDQRRFFLLISGMGIVWHGLTKVLVRGGA